MKHWTLLLFLTLAGISNFSRADSNAARAAYMRGAANQKAGQYQAAVMDYQASLVADNRYYWSYKQLGTCYYYLGDKSSALENYDKYLAFNPQDAQIRKLADGLRRQIAGGPASLPTPTPFPTPQPLLHHFMAGLELGYNTYPMVGISGGMGLGGNFRYIFTHSWSAGIGIHYLNASASLNGGIAPYQFTETASAPALMIGPQFVYAYPKMPPNFALSGILEFDYVSLSGAGAKRTYPNYPNSNREESYSGSTVGLVSAMQGDWFVTPGISLQAVLGYRTAEITSVVVTTANGSAPAYGAISYTGFVANLGTAFWF